MQHEDSTIFLPKVGVDPSFRANLLPLIPGQMLESTGDVVLKDCTRKKSS